jgi:hypothetical protein
MRARGGPLGPHLKVLIESLVLASEQQVPVSDSLMLATE